MHKTRAVQVWVDVDEGVADLVAYLNTIPGVRTFSSCQGTIGEGGAEPYGPYVMVAWSDAATLERLQAEFDITFDVGAGPSDQWCSVHPRARTTRAVWQPDKRDMNNIDIHKFDGASYDEERLIAHGVLDAALEDERDATGTAIISPTLACFIECRIAMVLREYKYAHHCL